MSYYTDFAIDGGDYYDSVLDAVEDDGLLSPGDARKLVSDHGIDWSEWIKECPMGTNPRDAEGLLGFLGY